MPEFRAEIRLFVNSYFADTTEQAEQFLENYKEALAKTPTTNGLDFADYHLSFEEIEQSGSADFTNCGHKVIICPNGEGSPFECHSFCSLCEGFGEYCETCVGKPTITAICASCNYLEEIAVPNFRRDDSEIDEPLCQECAEKIGAN